MLRTIMIATVAILVGTTGIATAQGYPNGYGNRYSGYGYRSNGSNLYTDQYGLGYSNSARYYGGPKSPMGPAVDRGHNPGDTNGF